VNRLDDTDWKTILTGGGKPAPPDWTSAYLVPGTIIIPPSYESP